MSAAKRTEALGPWHLEWDDDYVTLQAFGAQVSIAVSASNPLGRTIVKVSEVPDCDVEVLADVEVELA